MVEKRRPRGKGGTSVTRQANKSPSEVGKPRPANGHTASSVEPVTAAPAGLPALKAAPLRKICVYCGSGTGRNPKYAEAADVLGRSLADRGIGLVYGGGGLGLMGQVARATLAAGGHVTGIIPEFLLGREHALDSVSELVVTGDMHERKRLMFERSDAFVALPGGIGTLEELVEQLTWAQLGRHRKPIVLANIDGFWSPFLALLGHMKAETFIRAGLDVTFTVVDRAEQIVAAAEAQMVADPALPDGVSIALF